MSSAKEMVDYDHQYTYVINKLDINSDVINAWWYQDNLFSPEECDEIVRVGRENGLQSGYVMGEDGNGYENLDYRVVGVRGIKPTPEYRWMFDRIGEAVARANRECWQYDIIGMREGLQFLEYENNGHYNWHKDVGQGWNSSRKLTAIIQLTDGDSYDGCDLELEGGIKLGRDRGSITIFPSYYSHIVHPHTGGEPRNSLAVWIYGPPLR